MSMDETHKIPPDQADAFAGRLRGALQRRRPHTRWIVVTTIVVGLAGLGLLAWWLHTPTDPVRLEVIAFDAVAAPDETPRLRAQLAFPDDDEHAPALLHNRDVVFLDASANVLLLPGQHGMQKSVKSDAGGKAVADWGPLKGKIDAIAVRYVDARFKQGSPDQASLFRWERGGKILLVDVPEALAQLEPDRWGTTPPDKILPRPHAAQTLQQAERKQYQIGYVALTPTRALTYRLVRGWVHAPKAEKERFPAGPVFGRSDYGAVPADDAARRELVESLHARFAGTVIYIVVRADATGLAGAGARVIVLGEGDPTAGVERAADWSQIMPLLNP
jgi:hypothetical protein